MLIGIIEKVIVDCLMEVGDEELRQDVFFVAGIPNDRVYRMDQHYPDSETKRLIEAVLSVTGLQPDQLYQLFSCIFFNAVEDVFPEFLRMCDTSEDLVRKQAKIHALIAAGSRDPGESKKSTDKFQLEDHGPHHISVLYKSELRLCGLYEELVTEAAKRFGDEVIFAEHICANDGAEACKLTVKWTSINGEPTRFAEPTPDNQTLTAYG